MSGLSPRDHQPKREYLLNDANSWGSASTCTDQTPFKIAADSEPCSSEMLPQINFGFLSVPMCAHNTMDTMDLITDSQSGSSIPDKDEGLHTGAYVPENYLSPEVYALLVAAEATFAIRADESGAADMDIDGQGPFLQTQREQIERSSPDYELPNMQAAPPKRFYTTFWRSITLRLMDQPPNAPSLHFGSSRANLYPSPEVD
jgi:hypothetical protein